MIFLKDYLPYANGINDDANIINKAIIDASRLKDKLIIEKGTYKASTIFLKSDMELVLEEGARIILTDDLSSLYDINVLRDTSINRPTWEDCSYNGKPSKYFIYGVGISNFKLSGKGIIDGNEEIFYGNITKYHIEGSFYPRIPLIYIEDGKNISFDSITLTRSAFWTLHLVGCDNVLINNINIINNKILTNCDGIDPDHSKNITIKNSYISCADDCIVLKATEAFKKYGDVYNINVSNCHLESTSAAIKIGTETVSNFKDIHFKNIKIRDTNRAIALMLRDGGSASNITFDNIDIETHLVSPVNWWGRAEVISLTNVKRDLNTSLGFIKDITFNNIKAKSENGIVIYGENISNIKLNDINIERIDITSWPKKDIDLRPSIYNVIDNKFYDLYSNGCKDIVINDTNLEDIKIED